MLLKKSVWFGFFFLCNCVLIASHKSFICSEQPRKRQRVEHKTEYALDENIKKYSGLMYFARKVRTLPLVCSFVDQEMFCNDSGTDYDQIVWNKLGNRLLLKNGTYRCRIINITQPDIFFFMQSYVIPKTVMGSQVTSNLDVNFVYNSTQKKECFAIMRGIDQAPCFYSRTQGWQPFLNKNKKVFLSSISPQGDKVAVVYNNRKQEVSIYNRNTQQLWNRFFFNKGEGKDVSALQWSSMYPYLAIGKDDRYYIVDVSKSLDTSCFVAQGNNFSKINNLSWNFDESVIGFVSHENTIVFASVLKKPSIKKRLPGGSISSFAWTGNSSFASVHTQKPSMFHIWNVNFDSNSIQSFARVKLDAPVRALACSCEGVLAVLANTVYFYATNEESSQKYINYLRISPDQQRALHVCSEEHKKNSDYTILKNSELYASLRSLSPDCFKVIKPFVENE